MATYHFSFAAPWYLLLLALLPLCWWWSARRLKALGPLRRWTAIGLRTLVIGLLVAAVAEIQTVRISKNLTVIYLLDQSMSIPQQRRREMIQYVNAAVKRQRKNDDRVGVIVFARDAAIEIPPFNDAVQMLPQVESLLDPEFTNLAAAMKLAQATFPEDAARRVVLVSDGNQNLGDALEQARQLAAAGIGIDVMPVRYARRAEVAVERVVLPGDIRRGQPFELKAVLTNSAQPTADDPGEVRGRLVVSRIAGDRKTVLNDDASQRVVLKPGKSVFTLRHEPIDAPDFYTYEARFLPDNPDDDYMPQNNRATAFTHIRGRGHVLLVAGSRNQGDYELLADRLRRQNREVTLRTADQAFAGLAELQPYDCVVLANVAREEFSDSQVQTLVRNTQQLGAGLVMLGGEHSFGPGGWSNTEMEEAMPVDFQVKNVKVAPRGALAMLMHASEMADGNYWQKVVAREAIKALGPRDYCGVIHWSMQEQWLWRPGMMSVDDDQVRKRMLGAIDRMSPGDMPAFEPAMVMAGKAFAALPDAAVKHMIIISDGDPSPPARTTTQALVNLKVTISTVAVGAHGQTESQLLNNIAQQGGGKYYAVTNPTALPKIYQREARRVARPLIHENANGMVPKIRSEHEMIRGLDALPDITGFVLTSRKSSSLVDTPLVSPEPAEEECNTLLAAWTYGLGRSVAFTSDAAGRWMASWTKRDLAAYDKLLGQIVGWSMRPVSDSAKFQVATELAEGQVRVVVSALDKNDQFLNFLNLSGTSVSPELKTQSMQFEQTAPGRYIASFPASDAGSYFLAIVPGAGQAPIRTGVNVPYSDEFRDRATNEPLLEQLARMAPQGGPAGMSLASLDGINSLEKLLSVNPFRHDLPPATSTQGIWHYLVFLATCLFFGDVFVRRVHVHFLWVPPLARRVLDWALRRQPGPVKQEYMERLRSRKAEVSQEIDERRAAVRFEVSATAPVDAAALEESPLPAPEAVKPVAPPMQEAPKSEEDGYTARLLRAKKKVWEEKKKD